jgi:ribonuclease BN (tRNA processing enzyme)
MRATILGGGGGAASPTRQTACTLIRDRNQALLVDVGSGAGRLVADPSMLDGVGELHVVLTHFHLDHLCGLPYLAMLGCRLWSGLPDAGCTRPPAPRSSSRFVDLRSQPTT